MEPDVIKMEIITETITETVKKAFIDAQIEAIAGSEILLNRIDNSFRKQTIDPFFFKEQRKLYAWRKQFFEHHFPVDTWSPSNFDESIFDEYSCPEEFVHMHVCPAQITSNFDYLLSCVAGFKKKGDIYLGEDEEASFYARRRWSGESEAFQFTKCDSLEDLYDTVGDELKLSFSAAVHLVAELHPKGPKTLEELAMRSVIMHGISLEKMSKDLQKRSLVGLYHLSDDCPDHIDDEGRKCFKQLKNLFEKLESDSGWLRECIERGNWFWQL